MGKKIVLIDDEPDLLKTITFRLKNAGYTVFPASDGQAALDVIERENPDLILLDLQLPVIDGITVFRTLKADSRFKRIPIIIISASIELHVIKEQLSADDYLIKPFDPEIFFGKIARFIG